MQGGHIHIAPDCFDDTWAGAKVTQLLSWALNPAADDILHKLLQKGRADAVAWAQLTGLADAAAPDGDDLYRYQLLQQVLSVSAPDMSAHFESN